jgi:hypothetical protein
MYGSGEPESAFHVDRRHEEPQHDIQEHGTSGIVAGKHSRRRPNRVLSMPCLPNQPLCACLTHLQSLCRPLFLWHSSVICEWRCALRNGTDVRVALTNLGRFQQSPTRPSRCTKWRWPKQTLSDQTRPSPYASLLVQLPERLPRRSHTPWISCGHGSQPTGPCNQGVGRHA